MRFLLFLSCGILIGTSGMARALDSIEAELVQKSVQKSISWLETDMRTWRNEHGCSACHHGPMYLWSVHFANQRGYTVNKQQLAEMTEWLLTSDEARIFPKSPAQQTVNSSSTADRMTTAMMGHKNLSQPTIYLTHALNAMPDQEPLKKFGWKRLIDHLASAQKEDGSFEGRDAWRPIFNTPQILTRFVVTGIQAAEPPDTESGEQQKILTHAETFLTSQPPDETQQGIALRILSQTRLYRQPADKSLTDNLSTLTARLKQLQRDDGGWSQTDDRASDAFATGQALFAMNRTGASVDDPIIKRGVMFLLKSQNPDGTWPMTSRPNPENGKPAEFLNPITYAATAWATIGLSSFVPIDKP